MSTDSEFELAHQNTTCLEQAAMNVFTGEFMQLLDGVYEIQDFNSMVNRQIRYYLTLNGEASRD